MKKAVSLVLSITMLLSITSIGKNAIGYTNGPDGEDILFSGVTIKSSCNNAAVEAYIAESGTDKNGTKITWSKTHDFAPGAVKSKNATEYTKIFTCTREDCSATEVRTYKKTKNGIKVTGKTAKVSFKKLKKKKVYLSYKKAMKIKKANGKVTFKKQKGNRKSLSQKTAKSPLKKDLKRDFTTL